MSMMQALIGSFSSSSNTIATLTSQGPFQMAASTAATKTASVNIGTATSTRWVIIFVRTPVTTITPRTFTSATINGVTATIAYSNSSSTTSGGNAAIFANVTTGTTGVTVNVVTSGASANGTTEFLVYTLDGRTTLSYVSSSTTTIVTGTSRTNSLAMSAGGFNFFHLSFGTTAPTALIATGTPANPTAGPFSTPNLDQTYYYDNSQGTAGTATVSYSWTNSTSSRNMESQWAYV